MSSQLVDRLELHREPRQLLAGLPAGRGEERSVARSGSCLASGPASAAASRICPAVSRNRPASASSSAWAAAWRQPSSSSPRALDEPRDPGSGSGRCGARAQGRRPPPDWQPTAATRRRRPAGCAQHGERASSSAPRSLSRNSSMPNRNRTRRGRPPRARGSVRDPRQPACATTSSGAARAPASASAATRRPEPGRPSKYSRGGSGSIAVASSTSTVGCGSGTTRSCGGRTSSQKPARRKSSPPVPSSRRTI